MKSYLDPEKAKRLLKKSDDLYAQIINIQNRMFRRMGPVWDPDTWNKDPEAAKRFRLIVKELKLRRRARILNGEMEPTRFPRQPRRFPRLRFPRTIQRFPRLKKKRKHFDSRQMALF